jgi:nucleolar protein 56
LGVTEEKLAASISEAFPVKCDYRSQTARELLRGIRVHFSSFVKVMEKKDVAQARLGLSHAYSRSKIKFNVNRADNHIIQSISLLDQLDKDINTFAMRVREWYSWHFPELVRIASDNILFARLAMFIQSKSSLDESKIDGMEEIVNDRSVAEEILEAARTSMGTEISELDMMNITNFAKRVVSLDEYRRNLHAYLSKKMGTVAPNLSALIGDQVGARLIAHAGSLTNLAKYPASTVQILGAEKALFRALKTRGNTPKYGLIFHSSFIGRAGARDKGRISRFLANKCSMASRIDSFSEQRTNTYGEKMKAQVEERLEFYETGKAPQKNIDAMHDAALKAKEEEDIMTICYYMREKECKKE